jgi:predicted ArsR family transcriptional regulator
MHRSNMVNVNIPAEVVDLMRRAVHTYEALDVLLLILRRGGGLTATDAAHALSIREDIAEPALRQLAEAGVIEQSSEDGSVRHGDIRESLRPVVGRLADAYRDHRVDIVVIMNNQAVERMRSAALRAFADAFVLRRKDG